MEERLHGVVDGFASGTQLSGWVKRHAAAKASSGSSPAAIDVEVFLGDRSVGAARVGLHRGDLGGNHGFKVQLDEPVVDAAILGGDVRVEARGEDGSVADIPFYSGLTERLRKAEPDLGDDELLALLRRHAGGAPSAVRRRLSEVIPYVASRAEDLVLATKGGTELSAVTIRPGLKSANDIAVVGRNGYLFVYRGTNDLIAQYRKDPGDPSVAATAQAWIGAFERRRADLTSRGCRYLQMIIPEKSSLHGDLYPIPIPHPTPLFAEVERRIGESPALSDGYVRCLDALRTHPEKDQAFLKLDTHMAVPGVKATFEAMLGQMGYPTRIDLDLPVEILRPADLGSAFTGMAMHEVLALPHASRFAYEEARLVQREAYAPPGGQHLGTRRVWTNEGSVLPIRVVAFANSFFERGTTAMGLSWWAARWFREFHFVWSAGVDRAYVDRIQPDWVIGQTIERFLPAPPST